ncbi:MAG: nicotinate-nucleotide--dimethylbenzimidazole phosphoribosyltransferase [Geminicoccaceae bacterium]|nr:nicotinate-nucleotide--dimethylbenzimidazole phosphoribosyltransferase [Geminicoccaceae bacterium]
MSSLTPVSSFDDVRHLMGQLPRADAAATEAAAAREAWLTKPAGALGRLEDIAAWVAAWQGRHPPRLDRVGVFVFAGNHGVTKQGVSAFPPAVTAQMVLNFEAGGAAINQLAQIAGAGLTVVPLDLERPTADFTKAPAMSEAEAVDAFNQGLAAPDDALDLMAVGEMGIGNTTAAAALAAALAGGEAADWAGPGTGLDPAGVARKAAAIRKGLERHEDLIAEGPLHALRALGGREIAAMAGAILAGRLRRAPVLLDGYVATAAALVLHAIDPASIDHCLAGHASAEPAHKALLAHMSLDPLLDLGMRLGEASGAALAIPIVRAAVACHAGMATFESAGVSGKG